MAKKFNCVLLVLSLLLFAGCSNPLKAPTEHSSEETIALTFKIVDESADESVILFDDEVKVTADCETLADALLQAKEIQAVTEEGQYGLILVGMMGKESNWDKGPWWMYESSNNESCVKMGYCDGASNLVIQDGDEFVFTLSMGY